MIVGDSLIYCCRELSWIDFLAPCHILAYLELKKVNDQLNYITNHIRFNTTYSEMNDQLDTLDLLYEKVHDLYSDYGEGIVIIWFDNKDKIGYPVIIKDDKLMFGNQYNESIFKDHTGKFLIDYLHKKI